MGEVAYRSMNFSEGGESAAGRCAEGPSMDGKAEFEYVADPQATGPEWTS
jgi:Mn-containing catalase